MLPRLTLPRRAAPVLRRDRPVPRRRFVLASLSQFATSRLAVPQRARALALLRQVKFACSCGQTLAQCAQASPQCGKVQEATGLLLTRLQQGYPVGQVAREVQTFLTEVGVREQTPTPLRPVFVPVLGAPALGPKGATLTIVAFLDLTSAHSRRALGVWRRLQLRYGHQNVRVVVRHFPLPTHALATRAAEASMCAQAQSQFWPYVEKLLAHRGALAHKDLIGYANGLTLDRSRFVRELSAGHYRRAVAKDFSNATHVLRLPGAPYLFINGLPLHRPSQWAHVAALAWQRAQLLLQQGVPPQHLYETLIKGGKRHL